VRQDRLVRGPAVGEFDGDAEADGFGVGVGVEEVRDARAADDDAGVTVP